MPPFVNENNGFYTAVMEQAAAVSQAEAHVAILHFLCEYHSHGKQYFDHGEQVPAIFGPSCGHSISD